MSLRIRKSGFLCALAVVACSAGYENGTGESESVAEVRERLVLSSTANCTVEMTKIDYDQVGSDTSDYIELKVTKKGPGIVNTLGDCGVGAIALYDDAGVVIPGVLCTSYSFTSLGNVVIPADGYVEIGQNQSTVGIVASGDEGWIHNGRSEIAILNTVVPDGIPTMWLQVEGTAKCNLLALPVIQIQTESNASPNVSNVSCDNTFHTLDATSAIQKTPADCPTIGPIGSGGSDGTGGGGGLLNLSGTGGLLNSSGTGGLLNSSGTGGLLNSSGTGGLLNLAGNAGGSNVAGGGASAVAGGGTVGEAGSGVVGDAGADAGGVGGMAGSAGGGSSMVGDAGEASAHGGTDGGPGGSSSTAARAGKAEVGNAGNAHALVVEGGGCSCSIPSAPNQDRTRAFAVVAALVGFCLRRRRQLSN